ncbi:hypothetical protein KIPB_003204 [Kipferlia bialata]|uniref:DOD-type homing endonuclease domain-containing protein n=1 Tax=Kipferlia bialata TaxID=797122 RepID=A0A391P188_9EUKA|nr:hypothetical protein KIPB_003204 [Kipferlia bialata]|eukprot:g3204.t1
MPSGHCEVSHPLFQLLKRTGFHVNGIKNIPDWLLSISVESKRHFVAGCIESDGTIEPPEGQHRTTSGKFANTNYQFVIPFRRIAASLGYGVRTTLHVPKSEKSSPVYKVGITHRTLLGELQDIWRLHHKNEVITLPSQKANSLLSEGVSVLPLEGLRQGRSFTFLERGDPYFVTPMGYVMKAMEVE